MSPVMGPAGEPGPTLVIPPLLDPRSSCLRGREAVWAPPGVWRQHLDPAVLLTQDPSRPAPPTAPASGFGSSCHQDWVHFGHSKACLITQSRDLEARDFDSRIPRVDFISFQIKQLILAFCSQETPS